MTEPLAVESPQATINRARDISERFWKKVVKTDDDDCWEWIGTIGSDGYGRISFGSPSVGDFRMLIAHRVSWRLSHGEIPDGLFVLHKCDNRLCVRPDHLFLGTHQDNMNDMVSKGRSCAGSKNGMAILSEKQISEAVSRFDGGESQGSIAKSFGVSRATIGYVVSGKTWNTGRKPLSSEEVRRRALGGDRHPGSKLLSSDIVLIRGRYEAGGITQAELAAEYGVTQGTIGKIVRRELWR